MHKDYWKFTVAYYYLIIVAYFKIIWNSKNKIMYYRILRDNAIHSIVLSRSRKRSLRSYYERNGEVKRAKGLFVWAVCGWLVLSLRIR
jgi:hypothetical protein